MEKQIASGKVDAGTRGAVTGGGHLSALETLIVDILFNAGLTHLDIKTKSKLQLPGYYRSEKKWDLLAISKGILVAVIECKSQVGSFGNNFNNRTEEAIGSAQDFWTAYREKRFGVESPRPFLGYLFVLEDSPRVHRPIKNWEPHFKVDPIFQSASYCKRYEILFQRLVLERLYDVACLALATKPTAEQPTTKISHPSPDLNFQRFVGALEGHVHTFLHSF